MNVGTKKQGGFTIIEVVLVLAIAGLIFLIVFLALPALQRQQRDTQRRSDGSRVLTAIQNYQGNNAGGIPDTAAKVAILLDTYLTPATTDVFNDPGGTAYSLVYKNNTTDLATVPPANTMFVYSGARCNGEAAVAGSANMAAVRLMLENGGTFCASNAN